jgi:uncharacterized radical SAM superfamily Fe-S cluster-containing enzyme
MLNTNGIRIANEPGFAERLRDYAPGFEVYLQWDSLQPPALKTLRGVDLSSVRRRALQNLAGACAVIGGQAFLRSIRSIRREWLRR